MLGFFLDGQLSGDLNVVIELFERDLAGESAVARLAVKVSGEASVVQAPLLHTAKLSAADVAVEFEHTSVDIGVAEAGEIMVFKKHIDTGKSFLLPVIPVIEIVVFPSTIVPLFVNRRISIRALEQAISTNSDILVVTQTEKSFDEKINVEKLPKVGTICKIIQSMKWNRFRSIRK